MYDINTPCIIIAHNNSLLFNQINEVQYGIEEEGLFSKKAEFHGDDIYREAALFARKSTVGICVMITETLVLLTYEKCDVQFPVLLYNPENPSLNFFRLLGKNSARLAKGLPFIDPHI